ncbi:MAG: arginyltransferase [Desulfurivibrio sp.]|nr:arginyltransferase [Desulfurivibrio sp.]
MRFEQRRGDEVLRDYLFEIPAECPYGLEQLAIYRQAPCPPLSGELFDDLLAAGYRRNGNTIYTMACVNCRACVPIRLRLADFKPNRNQRRVWARNRDLEIEHGPLRVSEEKLALCERFLARRYPEKDPERGGWSPGTEPEVRFARAIDYYSGFFFSSITETYEISYFLQGRLLGLAVVDLTPAALNAVYFYFDPDQAPRSPGTMNILYLVELGRRLGCEFLYLGYWIEEVAAMSYKARFKPHQLLLDGVWQSRG